VLEDDLFYWAAQYKLGCTKFVVTSGKPDREGDTGYSIYDSITNTLTNYSFSSPPPIVESSFPDQRSVYAISPDAKAIIRRIGITDTSDELWRYDIEEGKWSKLLDAGRIALEGVGPGGKILGIVTSQADSEPLTFVDGYTGQPIRSYQDLFTCIIGERWVVCGINTGAAGLKVLDMANNWAETTLPFPGQYSLDYAFYVPPPGGVDEMQRMRKDESP
jgi:hypothetical protein